MNTNLCKPYISRLAPRFTLERGEPGYDVIQEVPNRDGAYRTRVGNYPSLLEAEVGMETLRIAASTCGHCAKQVDFDAPPKGYMEGITDCGNCNEVYCNAYCYLPAGPCPGGRSHNE